MKAGIHTIVDKRIPGLELRLADAVFGFDAAALIPGLDEVEFVAVLREAWLRRGRDRWTCRGGLQGRRGSRRGTRGGGGGGWVRRDSPDHAVALASDKGGTIDARIQRLEIGEVHAPGRSEGLTSVAIVGGRGEAAGHAGGQQAWEQSQDKKGLESHV